MFFSLKASEVGGIKETFCVLTVLNTSLQGGLAESCLAELLGASPREGSSPKTKVVHDLLCARSSYSRSMSGLFGRSMQLL